MFSQYFDLTMYHVGFNPPTNHEPTIVSQIYPIRSPYLDGYYQATGALNTAPVA